MSPNKFPKIDVAMEVDTAGMNKQEAAVSALAAVSLLSKDVGFNLELKSLELIQKILS